MNNCFSLKKYSTKEYFRINGQERRTEISKLLETYYFIEITIILVFCILSEGKKRKNEAK